MPSQRFTARYIQQYRNMVALLFCMITMWSCSESYQVMQSLPLAMPVLDKEGDSVSDFNDPSLGASLPLLEMFIFILLMMDILLKVPRLRLMLVAFRRFIRTGRLC